MRPRAQLPIFRSPNFNGLLNSSLTAPVACRYKRLQLINPNKQYIRNSHSFDEHPKKIVKNRRRVAASAHCARRRLVSDLVKPAGLAVVATIPLGVNISNLNWVTIGRRHVGRPACAKDARRIPVDGPAWREEVSTTNGDIACS